MTQAPPSSASTQSPQRAARILIVDDSAVVRRLLRTVISSDSRLEVAGTASDGASALLALDSIRPDLVLLDVEMPGVDGLGTLKQMRAARKHIPVIMCSSLTQRGAKVTIEALACGAADYVAKPSGNSSREAAMQLLAQDLIPKILALTANVINPPSLEPHSQRGTAGFGGNQGTLGAFGAIAPFSPRPGEIPGGAVAGKPALPSYGHAASAADSAQASAASAESIAAQSSRAFPARPSHSSAPPFPVAAANAMQASINLPSVAPSSIEVVLIGVSTGGPAALDSVLPAFPSSFPLPILIVQHMPELFTSLLAERLNDRCSLRVCEAATGEPVRQGTIYIARGDWHMEVVAAGLQPRPVSRDKPGPASATNDAIAILRLNRQPPENHCRPAVDVLFRSAANLFGGHVLGVILTGMGSDGLIGSRLIRERGGMILAQDQATSAVWGMPGAVTQAGLAQRVLPLNAIAPEILRLAGRSKREAQELRESTVNL